MTPMTRLSKGKSVTKTPLIVSLYSTLLTKFGGLKKIMGTVLTQEVYMLF